MKPLKKGFEASAYEVKVKIQGSQYIAANLMKSGILNRTTILLAVDEVWHEVNFLNLGADDSNLDQFKIHVELHDYSLKDFGILIVEEKPKKDYDLKHEDFMALETKFPCFSYIYISKLNDHLKNAGGYSGKYGLNQTLNHIKKTGFTIQDYIKNSDLNKQEIIKNGNKSKHINMKDTQNDRISYLLSLGFVYDENTADYVARWGTVEAPASFQVSLKSISDDTDEKWNSLVERIEFNVGSHREVLEPTAVEPAPETHNAVPMTAEPQQEPQKKPVSLATIGNMPANRILEFQKLLTEQKQIVKENPVITITDAESLKKAEATAKILLKASTKIDAPKTGVLSKFITHANQFIKMGKDYLEPIAKMTRDPYLKQKTLIDAFKSAEELRKQKEAKEKLEKIQSRTNQLFAVPMVFNGSQYVIGTLYILPSMIESSTDEQFADLLSQAKAIKTAQDAAAQAESAKDKEIEELKQKLAALMAQNTPAAAPVTETPQPAAQPAPQTAIHGSTVNTPAATVNTPPQPAAQKPTSAPAANDGRYQYATEYVEATPDNAILLNLDLENVAHLANPNFIKCRAFYVRGILDTVKQLDKIFASDSKTKGQDIRDYLDIIRKSA